MQDIFEKYWNIKSYQKEIPYKIPVIFSSGDPVFEVSNKNSMQLSLYFNYLKEGSMVLDIGAGDQLIEKALIQRGINAKYYSLDTAKADESIYDFRDIEEINETFDLIIMQEVIEHLPLEIGYKYLKRAYEMLNNDGYFVITTPDVRRPIQFHKSDFSHIQHYPLKDLYGILRCIGFSNKAIFRMIEIKDPTMTIKQRAVRLMQKALFKLQDFSFNHSILIMISKEN